MTCSYILKVKTEFSGAHVIYGYDGPCNRLHGHNWKVEMAVATSKLDDLGMGVDFRDLKKQLNVLADMLDHQNLNELPYFSGINPTAENIAKWFYDNLDEKIASADTKLVHITLWETDNCYVTYSKD